MRSSRHASREVRARDRAPAAPLGERDPEAPARDDGMGPDAAPRDAPSGAVGPDDGPLPPAGARSPAPAVGAGAPSALDHHLPPDAPSDTPTEGAGLPVARGGGPARAGAPGGTEAPDATPGATTGPRADTGSDTRPDAAPDAEPEVGHGAGDDPRPDAAPRTGRIGAAPDATPDRGRDAAPDDGPAASAELLAWYDRHARALPWRVGPGSAERPDPYRVWLSEVMLQQTTVAAVRPYFERFTARWPDVESLAAAEDGAVMAAWAGLGYYARARNLLACARAVAAMGGFPDTEGGLRALPGLGAYTAAAVAAIAFGRPAVVVDGNVERVMARLHAVEAPLPGTRRLLREHAAALTPARRPGDHAQAVMDLGATVCTPRRPACGVCPWVHRCAGRRAGIAETLPRRAPKAPRPERTGTLWVARRADGAWLLERRPARGMLGGTLGWPGTAWETGSAQPGGSDPSAGPDPSAGTDRSAGSGPPVAAEWSGPAGAVAHGFSHFTVTLEVLAAEVASDAVPERGAFVPADAFDPADLPTLMRRAHGAAAALLTPGPGRARPPAGPPSSS